MHYFLRVGLKSCRTQRIYRQLYVLKDSCLNCELGQSIVSFIDISCKEFCCSISLFYAVHPDLNVLVFICHYFVRVCICYRLETSCLACRFLSRLR